MFFQLISGMGWVVVAEAKARCFIAGAGCVPDTAEAEKDEEEAIKRAGLEL